MSLPPDCWTISVDEQTKALCVKWREKFSPRFNRSRSEFLRFVLLKFDEFMEVTMFTPETLDVMVRAIQHIYLMKSSQHFPAAPSGQAGKGEGAASRVVKAAPLEFRVSRLLQGASAPEEMEAWELLSARGTRGWHGSTLVGMKLQKYVHTGRAA